MKSAAVLLDGGFVLKRLYSLLGRQHATSQQVLEFAHACIAPDEELFRIYFYDCPPFEDSASNPLNPEERIDFSRKPPAIRKQRLHNQLALCDQVAFRRGELRLQGWRLKEAALREIASTPRLLTEADLSPGFSQKRVDMNIGLDVAWLASKRIVDRLILVTGDTDFVPAMKFARREGAQVILVPMGASIKSILKEHADFIRNVEYPNVSGESLHG